MSWTDYNQNLGLHARLTYMRVFWWFIGLFCAQSWLDFAHYSPRVRSLPNSSDYHWNFGILSKSDIDLLWIPLVPLDLNQLERFHACKHSLSTKISCNNRYTGTGTGTGTSLGLCRCQRLSCSLARSERTALQSAKVSFWAGNHIRWLSFKTSSMWASPKRAPLWDEGGHGDSEPNATFRQAPQYWMKVFDIRMHH